jgi:flagellar biosynthetic protein FliR
MSGLTLELYVAFLVMCRLGTCLMLMPGLSSLRVPVQIRLLVVVALAISLSQIVPDDLRNRVAAASNTMLLEIVAGELFIGGVIGLLGRIYFAALQFAATAAANFVGLAQLSGLQMDAGEAAPELAVLVSVSATVLLMVLDLHWEIIRALMATYHSIPATRGIAAESAIVSIIGTTNDAFRISLQVASPFLAYAVIVNLAIGIANRLQPNIPVYFVALPAVTFGGLLLAYFVLPQMMNVFANHFGLWLRNG